MLLYSAPASPFARKIRIVIHMLALSDRVSIVSVDTMNPSADFVARNPLGKIPVLVLDHGETLYDSRVIAAYLDALAGGRMTPVGPDRLAAMRFEALADGIMDAIVLQVYERRWRAEDRREPRWVRHQADKVERGLSEAERLVGSPKGELHMGHVALACALGYLDLRFEGAWRRTHPGLVSWLEQFSAAVPAFEATRHVDPPRAGLQTPEFPPVDLAARILDAVPEILTEAFR